MTVAANTVLDRCASTNDLARELGEQGAPHGTWISARVQEQGRGRLGRQWQSLEGNLFLSLVVRLEDRARWTWVPLATAVAVARYLEKRFAEVLEVRIKWPNDLWLLPAGAPPGAGGAKLGGILCEAVGNRSGAFIVIGLGLNCTEAPEGLDQQTASLSGALQRRVAADDVREGVIEEVMGAVDELAVRGSSELVRDFERMAAFPPGSPIEWTVPGAASELARHGSVRGLGPSGELIVVSADGAEQKLYAEDVRVRSLRSRASDGSPA
jgi:BirA family transcriptional regulator, biotin operon repressor / biotin---[acetyl-CoA-carboxylase] ligase